MNDHASQPGDLAMPGNHQPIIWKAKWRLEKFHGDNLDTEPFEVIDGDGNLLMYGGASCIWECLIGNGTSSSGTSLTYFSNSNAALGVGDSTAAEAATQTDLQAATNKQRKTVDATYPSHTDGTSSGSATVTFKATFGTSDANFHWQEWGVFNATSGGRMLNRKVTDLGTKTSAASWAFTVTLTLA